MKRVIHSLALVGLVIGGAFVDDTAQACTTPFWQDTHCECHYKSTGYDLCTSTGSWCWTFGSGCGDGPGPIPF